MAPAVRPIVRLVMPCDEVHHDPAADRVTLIDPLPVAALPPGQSFPVVVTELWVYTQLTEGVGTFRLSVEVRQVYDEGIPPRPVGRSETRHLTFPGANQLNVYDVPFRVTDVPFEGPGFYEFRVLADDQELQGQTALMRVFDPRTTP